MRYLEDTYEVPMRYGSDTAEIRVRYGCDTFCLNGDSWGFMGLGACIRVRKNMLIAVIEFVNPINPNNPHESLFRQ